MRFKSGTISVIFHLNQNEVLVRMCLHLVLHHVCFCSVCFHVFERADSLFLYRDNRKWLIHWHKGECQDTFKSYFTPESNREKINYILLIDDMAQFIAPAKCSTLQLMTCIIIIKHFNCKLYTLNTLHFIFIRYVYGQLFTCITNNTFKY